MGRAIIPRTVCSDIEKSFVPKGVSQKYAIQLSLEEYETIRLIDLEKLSQLECSQMINVSRTTVQTIYESARYKIAQALVYQKGILIKGGNYQLCQHDRNEKHCAKNQMMDSRGESNE